MENPIDKSKIIRDAATIILLRSDQGTVQVLMGQRGHRAVFMPNKYVFPGGAVDPEDYQNNQTGADPRLDLPEKPGIGPALVQAATRELVEETGLVLADACQNLQFIFRAITPPGRPRRFDARFFLCDAGAVSSDLDDFSEASDELGHLHWINLTEAKSLELPFITEVVLSEVLAWVDAPDSGKKVPFFHHEGGHSFFSML